MMIWFEPLILAVSAALYTLAALAHVLYMFRREFEVVAKWSTRTSWAVQTLALVALIIETGRAPLLNLFEFSFLFSWFLMTNYTVLEYLRENQAAGAFLVPVVAVVQVLGVAMHRGVSDPSNAAALSFSLIAWHVAVTLLGYALLTASFVSGALYLLQERHLRLKRWGPLYYRLPSLETLDIWSGRFVQIGFPLLTLGIVSGLIFAHATWQTLWESKVLFTLVVWLVYGYYLFMRTLAGWRGRKAAWWAIAGVAGILINYFVINLFSRLHFFGV